MGPRGMRMGSGEGSTMRKLHSLYRSPNIVKVNTSRRLRWEGHVARMEEDRGAFKILKGTPTGKRTLGRHRHIKCTEFNILSLIMCYMDVKHGLLH